MKYHILDEKDEIIASFIHKDDRDICLDALEDYWNVAFEPKDEDK